MKPKWGRFVLVLIVWYVILCINATTVKIDTSIMALIGLAIGFSGLLWSID